MGRLDTLERKGREPRHARPERRLRELARRLGWAERDRRAVAETLRNLEGRARRRTVREIEAAAEADGPPGWAWAAATRLRRWATKEGYGDLRGDPYAAAETDDPFANRPSRESVTELRDPSLPCWLELLARYGSEPEPGEIEDLLVSWMDAGFVDPLDVTRTLLGHLTLLHLRDPGVRL